MTWYATSTSAGYAKESAEAYSNALEIYATLSGLGWSRDAVCAFLGNVDAESEYNPWQWENDDVLSSTDRSESYPGMECDYGPGYGLVQWTPASGYILSGAQSYPQYAPYLADKTYRNPEDGIAQLLWMHNSHNQQWYPVGNFRLTYDQFIGSTTYTVEYLAEAFMREYLRPYLPTAHLERRQEAARYWYDTLPNKPPTPPPTKKKKGLKVWQMVNNRPRPIYFY